MCQKAAFRGGYIYAKYLTKKSLHVVIFKKKIICRFGFIYLPLKTSTMKLSINRDATFKNAGIAYTAYCKSVGGKDFNENPLPDYETFVNDPKKIKQAGAWRSAVNGIYNNTLSASPKTDIACVAYEGYYNGVGGITWNGEKLLGWDKLPEIQANGWRAAVIALKGHVHGA